MTPTDRRRPVEVFGPRGYGSGYRVSTGLVLTAAHIVAGSAESAVVLRDLAGRRLEGHVEHADTTADVAVIRLIGSATDGALPPVTLGRFPERDTTVREFSLYGWPRAGAQEADDGSWMRDPVDVVGEIRLAERVTEGSGLLRLRPSEHYPPLTAGSWWEGMSGAAVVCEGVVVGVQIQHPRAEIPGYLAAALIAPLAAILAILARDGVLLVDALDKRTEAVAGYLRREVRRLVAAPAWFPARFRRRAEGIEPLFQPVSLEFAGRPVADLDAVTESAEVVIVRAEPGGGKSWLLAAHARDLTRRALAGLPDPDRGRVRIPAFTRAAEIGERDTLSDLTERAVASLPGGLAAQESTGADQVTLIVDGVDEATERQKRVLAAAIDELLVTPHDDRAVSSMILGSRPGEFEVPPDERIRVVDIVNFSPEKQSATIAAWFDGSGRALYADRVRALADHWRIGQAFRTPLILALACLIVEQGQHLDEPELASAADVLRAAILTLVDNAHRSAHLTSTGTVAARRARGATLSALQVLARRAVDDAARPFVGESAIADIDAHVLDACVETGLVNLRADGAIEFANGSLMSYLAAQEVARRGWDDLLGSVWEGESPGEVLSFVPHSLAAPLLGDPDPARLRELFAAIGAQLDFGDPGFVLLYITAAALSYTPRNQAPLGVRNAYAEVLEAHVASGLDPRAASALALLDPARLAAAAPENRQLRLEIGLVLANAGRDEGYALLNEVLCRAAATDADYHDKVIQKSENEETILLGGPSIEDQVPGVLEWVARRGDAEGHAVLRAVAERGDFVGACATLLCVRLGLGPRQELLRRILDAPALHGTHQELIAAGLLMEDGDEVAQERLRARFADGDRMSAATIFSWLAGDVPEARARLVPILDDNYAPRRIAAALCLGHLDANEGLATLERLALGDHDDNDAAVAALVLANSDPARGLAVLRRLAERGSLEAAGACVRVDPVEGRRVLGVLAGDEGADPEQRVVAARLLTALGHPEGEEHLTRLAAAGEEAATAVLQMVSEKSALITAEYGIALTSHGLQEILAAPSEMLELFVTGMRTLPEIRPSQGLPPDIDSMLTTDFGADSNAAPGLLPRLNLADAVDRRALAVSIPLFDVPADREYFVTRGAALAPDDDWLRLLARWSVGDFEDSPRTEDEERHEGWAAAITRTAEALMMDLGWLAYAWGDPAWIAGRCFPLVLKHGSSGALVALARSARRPLHPTVGKALNGIRPRPGLGVPAARTEVGQTCLSAVAAALDGLQPKFATVLETYRRRLGAADR